MIKTYPCPNCRRQLTINRQDYVKEDTNTYVYITQYGCQQCEANYFQTTSLTDDQPRFKK